MIPPEFLLLLHHQRHELFVRQAGQARLVRASRRKRDVDVRTFQPLLWWVGGVLFSWGCALQRTGRARAAVEKGCCACL
jgi:hypothetical protein